MSIAAVIAAAIFALDVLTPLQGAVAVLYTVVVLAVAAGQDRRVVATAGLTCAALAVAAYAVGHAGQPLGSPAVRLAVSLVAIASTTWLCRREIAAAADRRRADARYATIFNAAGLPIWESDWSWAHDRLAAGEAPTLAFAAQAAAAARVRDANAAAARLFGYDAAAELIAAGLSRHHSAAGHQVLLRIFAALSCGEAPAEAEVRFITAAGAPIDVVLRVTVPPHDQGWRQVLVTALDVTQRNRAQVRLADAQAELARLARVTTLGQLAASIAHEVNQPLSAIVTYARSGRRWLARSPPDLAELGTCLDGIAASGLRAAAVITRIRDHAARSPAVMTAVDLAAVIDDTLALLGRELASAGVAVRVAVAPDLPPVTGDRVQLQQVLINLLLNAGQALAARPTADRHVDIVARADGNAVMVTVADRGPGFGGADPESLFQAFVTTRENGMGMGLSIGRTIAERHRGALTAAERPEGGAVFQLMLPARGAADEA